MMKRLSGGIQLISEVHSQLLFCKSAAVIRVTRGKGLFHERYDADRWSQLCIGNQPLYTSHVDHTGSYQDIIRLGYWGSDKSKESKPECAARLNETYTNLVSSIDDIHLLLNLLERGTYLIGDFELFPVQKEENRAPRCFWDLPERNGCYWPYPEIAEWCGHGGYAINLHPLYLVPTQPAKMVNPDRMQMYMERIIQDFERAPRSIGLYLRGSAVLLLDGHHKALAASALGVPAKTLVIFGMEDEEILKAAEQKNRLFLRRTPSGIEVCNDDESYSCGLHWFGEKCGKGKDLRIMYDEPNVETWGVIDEKWIAEMKNPHMMREWVLRDGTALPYYKIKEIMGKLQKMPPEKILESRESCVLVHQLRQYNALNPNNKWISPAQRQWLEDLYEKYRI